MIKIKSFLVLLWKNFIHWVHANGSTRDFILKVIIGVFVFIILSDLIKKFVKWIEQKISKGERPNKVSHFFLILFQYLTLIFLVYEIANQINTVEVNPLVTITASACIVLILVIQGALYKLVTNLMSSFMRLFRDDDDPVNIDSTVIHVPKISNVGSVGVILSFFLKLFRKIVGIAVAVALVYITYQGILYVTDSSGFEVARMLSMSEEDISKELDTSFHQDNSLISAATEFPDDSTRIMTDGHLNIIYENNIKVGVNTSSRKYKFYGIGINQPQVQNEKRMSYKYDGIFRRTEDLMGGKSNTYYYYNRQNNDCLAITVNVSSNRVANLTYYTDFSRIEPELNYVVNDGD